MIHDFTDYIVLYDRKYENGKIFPKGTFKSSNGRLVPVKYDEYTFKPHYCCGYAVIEDHEDGVVAKCNFYNKAGVSFTKRMLIDRKENALTFESTMDGIITAVDITMKCRAWKLEE